MKTRFFSLFAILLLMSASAFAENASELRHRMEQRLPQIDALKAQGVVGETNRGYLDERKSGVAEAAKIVADENRDREAVYTYIAKQTGSNADAVGRARAKRIAAASRPGVWVQNDSGHWVQK